MKKLFFLLSIILLSLSGTLKAQTQDSISKKAGVELTEYYKQNTRGIILTTIGSLMMSRGIFLFSNSSDYSDTNAGGMFLTGIGGVMTIIGGIDILLAPKHIRNAGLIMSGGKK